MMKPLVFEGRCMNCGVKSKKLIHASDDNLYCNRMCMNEYKEWEKDFMFRMRQKDRDLNKLKEDVKTQEERMEV